MCLLIQNAAARVLTRRSKREHIPPILKFLHSRPDIQSCKILLLTFKALNNQTPLSCRGPPVPNHPNRVLKARNAALLMVPVMEWASSIFFKLQTHFPYLGLYSKLFFLKWPGGTEGCSDFYFIFYLWLLWECHATFRCFFLLLVTLICNFYWTTCIHFY